MITEFRVAQLLNTLVFETLGQPEKEREFKIKTFKKWGFDLIFGKKDGIETFWGVEKGSKKAGDVYMDDEVNHEITEILEKLPKNKKMFARIEMIEGRAYLYVYLRENDVDTPILHVPAGEVLLAFLKKHKFVKIIEAVKNIGSAATLVKKHGDEGKPLPFEKLPPVPRRSLRDAKKIEKEMGFGRIALAYFGENKSGEARYSLEWMVPSIALFDEKISEKIDKALAEFK